MADEPGATLEQWHHWSETLGLTEHLLPVVANDAATISPDSNMKALGKTPSHYNFRGEAAGIAKWTEQRSTFRQIGKWELERDYGISIQSRAGGLQAIDIDVPGEKRSEKIVAQIENHFPLLKWWRRSRKATGKVLLPFICAEPITKRVLRVEGGIIEILGDGQQWIADSTYLKDNKPDGRYLWPAGRPESLEAVPHLTLAELDDLCADLAMWFEDGDSGWSIARQRREGTGEYTGPARDDEIGLWLVNNWEITGEKGDGTLFVRCPWIDQHSMDSGPSETQFAPPGNGFEKGHFRCLHAGCQNRSDGEFLEAMGFAHDMSDAPDLPAEVEPERGTEIVERVAARYMTDKQGRKENRAYNHELFLQDVEAVGLDIAWDDFGAQTGWRRLGSQPWQIFSDEHYQRIVMQMDRNGFVPQTAASIRSALHAHAMKNRVDTLIDWVEQLPAWDGMERVERFWTTYGKAPNTPYVRAVGRYSWTAQAGRALDPGCQADMVPVLVGPQGARKTSLVRAIAPNENQFVEINLMHRDEDTTRKMRGKCVAELGELRGMQTRDKEDIKAFLTKREEEWVPKYKEFPSKFKRRFVFYGTTNRDDFLGDETGERRWLPFWVGAEGELLDVEGVERDREQLWAEAVALWKEHGVMYKEAERLAAAEHGNFKDEDPWVAPVARWLQQVGALNAPHLAPCDMPYQWGTSDVLVGALGRRAGDLKRADQARVGAVLRGLGALKKQVRTGARKPWVYRVDREMLYSADELFA